MKRDAPPGDSSTCSFGILNLYWLVYSNYVLLNNNVCSKNSQPILNICLEKCKRILNFFEDSYSIPPDKDIAFLNWASLFFSMGEEDIYDCVFTSRNTLKKAGFRDIDMDLYVACVSFDLARVRNLIAQGADPNVLFPCDISDEQLPLSENYADDIEIDCVSGHVLQWIYDFFDCYDGMKYWEAAALGVEINIAESYLYEIGQSAANQVLYNTMFTKITYE